MHENSNCYDNRKPITERERYSIGAYHLYFPICRAYGQRRLHLFLVAGNRIKCNNRCNGHSYANSYYYLHYYRNCFYGMRQYDYCFC